MARSASFVCKFGCNAESWKNVLPICWKQMNLWPPIPYIASSSRLAGVYRYVCCCLLPLEAEGQETNISIGSVQVFGESPV